MEKNFDNIADYWEIYNYYTDPTKSDSDGDGAPDWFEISYMGYNTDTDGDGIANPWDWDSDGDLIPDGKEININPATENITFVTNPLVYNDFDENKTEIRQNIERDALNTTSDGAISVVVDYGVSSNEKPQIQKVSDYEYRITSSISENLKAEIRMKLSDTMIQQLNNDPYRYRMYYYDNAENGWKIFRHTDINLDDGYIWGVITHFTKVGLEDASTQDSDHDGLTDEYEMTAEYTAYYENCDGDVTWGQLGVERGYKDVIRWTTDAYDGASSWKMGNESGSYYMYSPAMNISMDEKSHATISFHYKYRNPSGQAYYSLYFISRWSKLYPGEDMIQENSGPWRFFSEDIYSKITGAYTYYKMPASAIPLNWTCMEFYAPNPNNYILIDEIKITAHTDLNNPDTDGDGISDGDEAQGQVTRYAVDMGNKGYLFSIEYPAEYAPTYTIRTFNYHTNPVSQDTDMDGQPDNRDLIPLDYDMDGDGYINSASIANPNSYYYNERIASAAENDPNLVGDANGNYVPDDDMDGDGIQNSQDADDDNDGMPDNYEIAHGVANGGWQNPYVFNARYGLLIVSGGYVNNPKEYDAFLPAFWNDGKELYDSLINDYNYLYENTYLMSSKWDVDGENKGHDPATDDIIDGECMWNIPDIFDIKDAIIEIGGKSTKNDFIFIAIIAHGDSGGFMVRNTSFDSQHISQHGNVLYEADTPSVINIALSPILNSSFGGDGIHERKYAVMTIVNQACHGAAMMPHLKGINRILISAARADKDSWVEADGTYGHWAFLHEGKDSSGNPYSAFTPNLGDINSPNSLKYAFIKGKIATEKNNTDKSYPQIDEDSLEADKIYM